MKEKLIKNPKKKYIWVKKKYLDIKKYSYVRMDKNEANNLINIDDINFKIEYVPFYISTYKNILNYLSNKKNYKWIYSIAIIMIGIILEKNYDCIIQFLRSIYNIIK